jgi:plastocyanin
MQPLPSVAKTKASLFSVSALVLTVFFGVLVGDFASAAPFLVTVADTRGVPLADAVVSLRPAAGKANAAPRLNLVVNPQPVVIQQTDREFAPKVTVVPVGSRISLPNNDVVPHSVYSFSAAKQFEFDVYVGSPPEVLTLEKTGVITLGCNIHDWMVGYVVVVDTPLVMKTDSKGVAAFANVPDGDYDLRVWHSQQRASEHVAAAVIGAPIKSQAVVLDVTPPRARYKPPLTLKPY